MPKPYPKEFRDDGVAVARKREVSLIQIAKDFGISEGCLSNWLKKADKLSRQAYYPWLAGPVSQRERDDAHAIDTLLGIHRYHE